MPRAQLLLPLLFSAFLAEGVAGKKSAAKFVSPRAGKAAPPPVAWDGLPGEQEFEVDVSDQEGKEGEQRQPADRPAPLRWLWFTLELPKTLLDAAMSEDIADRLDDLICAWDKVVGTDLNTLVLLLLGWLGFGAVIFLISHVIYSTLGPGDDVSVAVAAIPPFQSATPPPNTNGIGVAGGAAAAGPGLAPNTLVRANIQTIVNGGGGYPAAETGTLRKPLKVGGASGAAGGAGIPVTVGSDADAVDWVNKCFNYIYTEPAIFNEIINRWLTKLNEFTRRTALEDGLLVEFLELAGDNNKPPNFINMTTETLPNDNMTITCDVEATFEVLLQTSRPIKERVEKAEFLLSVDRLRGRFNITVITKESLLIIKLDGWPEIKRRLARHGGSSVNRSKEEQNLGDVAEEVATSAIRGLQLDLHLNELPKFPKFVRKVFPDKSAQNSSKLSYPAGGGRPGRVHGQEAASRRLEVKVVKGVGLGAAQGCVEPYVVLELDDPSQRKQTRAILGKDPKWEDQFHIDITKKSSELLFEVWDQGQKIGKSDAFMGLGIVSVDELLVTASQRHVIPLQGRPYEEDQVSGLLTVEFLFTDGGVGACVAEAAPGIHRKAEIWQSRTPAGETLTNTKTTYSLDASKELTNGTDVAQLALKELETHQKSGVQTNATKSTILIHSVQRPPRHSPTNGVTLTDSSQTDDPHGSQAESIGDTSITSRDSDVCSYPGSRSRPKKRNFMSSIKKRLTGKRSQSGPAPEGHGPDFSRDSSLNRGISSDRIRSASEHRPESQSGSYLTIPGQGEDASSMSDISGISNTSNKTFITEESSLVLETIEEGIKHHYLIPIQAARRGKFKKKGTKLHIYMDHIFVARHIKLGTMCQVCHSSIPLRLGKQAYECRDCGLVVHKPCHVRTDAHCQHTSLPAMELYRGSTIIKMTKSRGHKKNFSNSYGPPQIVSPSLQSRKSRLAAVIKHKTHRLGSRFR